MLVQAAENQNELEGVHVGDVDSCALWAGVSRA
jgi:hypothetical protein